MRLSQVVAELASSIEVSLSLTRLDHRIVIQLLKLMPIYVELNNLHAFSVAVEAVIDEDDTTEIGRIMNAVWDFTSDRFYVAFDPKEATRKLAELKDVLAGSGIYVTAGQIEDY